MVWLRRSTQTRNPRDLLISQWRNFAKRDEPVSAELQERLSQGAPRIRVAQLEAALTYLQEQVALARRCALFEGQSQALLETMDARYARNNDGALVTALISIWERMANDALILACYAEQLLLALESGAGMDVVPPHPDQVVERASTLSPGASKIEPARRPNRKRMLMLDQRIDTLVRQREVARIAIYCLREAMFCRLCYLRAEVNSASATNEIGIPTLGDMLYEVRRLNHAFDRQAARWRLRRSLHRELESGNASAYRIWSQQLGATFEHEPNWGIFVRSMGVELRYRIYLMELRARWREVAPAAADGRLWKNLTLAPGRFLQAVALSVFRTIAGFGLRPMRFVATAAATIAAFSVAYAIDDWLFTARHTLEPLGRYLYYAVVYLTSVGADQSPAGLGAPALIAIESLAGYFLLSVLAAMFFLWLTER